MFKVTTSQEVNQRLQNLPLRRRDKPFKFEASWAERGRRCKTTIQIALSKRVFIPARVHCALCFTKAWEAFLLLLCLYSQRVWKRNLLMSEKSLQHQEVNIFIFMNQLKAIMQFWAKERAFFFPLFSSFLPSQCQYRGTSYQIRPSGHLTTVNCKQSVNTVREINNTTAFVAEVTITLWVSFVLSFFNLRR